MKLRPIKYEFSAQRKEAHQEIEQHITATLRNDLGKILFLKRPLALTKAILNKIKHDNGTK